MGLISMTKKPELVAPASPTPYELKELSDIDDQDTLRFHVPVIMAYKNKPSMAGKDPARVIKEALAKALVYYYPLSGRLRKQGNTQKLVVECTGEGVLFLEVDATVTLEEVGMAAFFPPCPLLDELLIDVPGSRRVIDCPLLFFQVTRFKCGGFILGLLYNHVICDANGLVQLLSAMVEITRGASVPTVLPVWGRERFKARNLLHITQTHHKVYEICDESLSDKDQVNDLVQASYFFGPKEMRAINNHLPAHLQGKHTAFEIISACLWRCRTIALQLDPEDIVHFCCVVSLRFNKNFPPLPPGYYGNGFALPVTAIKVKLLQEKLLEYALDLVTETKSKVNKEYFTLMLDRLEVTKQGDKTAESLHHWVVADATRLGLDRVDLGWGIPIYGGVARANTLNSAFTRCRSGGEAGIIVPICLPRNVMGKFKKEVHNMIKDNQIYTGSPHETSTKLRSML